MVVTLQRSSHTCQVTSRPGLWGAITGKPGWLPSPRRWGAPEVPEDANEQLQGGMLDLAVERLLPGSSAGSALIQVCAGAQVGEVQLGVQPEALNPGRKQTWLTA